MQSLSRRRVLDTKSDGSLPAVPGLKHVLDKYDYHKKHSKVGRALKSLVLRLPWLTRI